MLTWSMQDANVDAKEAAKKVDVFIKVRGAFGFGAVSDHERAQNPALKRKRMQAFRQIPYTCASDCTGLGNKPFSFQQASTGREHNTHTTAS